MADEAENIGGINVQIGASHAQLPGDLAAADRIFEQYRAQWSKPIQLRAQAVQGQTAASGAVVGGPAGAQAAVRVIQQETRAMEQALADQGTRVRAARRKNIATRDIGTAVNPGRVYTFDPAVYAEQDKIAEARSARQRELALAANVARQDRENRPRTPRGGLTDEQRRAANNLNALGSNPPTVGLQSVTVVGKPERVPARDQRPLPRSRYQDQFDREEASRAQRAQRAQAIEDAGGTVERGAAARGPIDAIERQRRASLRDLTEFGRSRGGATGLNDEDFARRAEQRIATSESTSAARGRTARTTASSFGGQYLFGGPARQQAEAVARQAEAEQRLGLARRRLNDPSVIRDARAYRQATLEQSAAEENLAKATAKVQSLGGLSTAARSLAAVTVAGAAFGAGLTAIDFAVSALGPALGDAIDQATGFGATSNKVTVALAQQTLAARGNVNAVLATAEAQAGLSSSAADAIDSQIKLTTQIKAGAQAAGAAGGLFRASIGANQQVPQGLLGGYGGIGGGAFLGQQLGGGAGLAETIKSTFGDFSDATAALKSNRTLIPYGTSGGGATQSRQYLTSQQMQALETPVSQRPEEIARIAKDRAAAEDSLNQAAKRGAISLGATADAVVHFGAITADQAAALQASNLPQELKDLAKNSNEALFNAQGNLVDTFKKATDGLSQIGVGLSIPDSATFGRIALAQEQQRQRESQASLPAIQSAQAFARGPQIAAIGRQQQDALNRALPASQALGNLANPLQPTGTGIVAANAQEQQKINAGLEEANDLQAQLNAGYAQGRSVLEDTYKPAIAQNFGQAAGQAFDTALSAVERTGREIASIQAGISNESAAYQTAQYNFQLIIAKRTLSDIGGLTGKNFGAGESYLGVLERQNLALSRQGQLLQFALSQRQINFQTALAGFQAPGVTPEERQARIAEAKIEADYAQKQLDIGKQQFNNQVKIVDIGNLRQGADLAKQIALLIQGRRVTIDTAVAEKKIERLSTLQQQQVAKVSTYLTAVDNLTAVAMANIAQLEAAAGTAMTGIATTILGEFGIFYQGLTNSLNSGTGGGGGGGTPAKLLAGGGVLNTNGPIQIGPNAIAGEAGSETLLVLSHPRAVSGGEGGGATTVVVQFNGDIHTSNTADLERITQAVTKALGREASIKGLRGIG